MKHIMAVLSIILMFLFVGCINSNYKFTQTKYEFTSYIKTTCDKEKCTDLRYNQNSKTISIVGDKYLEGSLEIYRFNGRLYQMNMRTFLIYVNFIATEVSRSPDDIGFVNVEEFKTKNGETFIQVNQSSLIYVVYKRRNLIILTRHEMKDNKNIYHKYKFKK